MSILAWCMIATVVCIASVILNWYLLESKEQDFVLGEFLGYFVVSLIPILNCIVILLALSEIVVKTDILKKPLFPKRPSAQKHENK